MSTTIVDMPKVCQMLDAGWRVALFKNTLGTYTAVGRHPNAKIWQKAKSGHRKTLLKVGWSRKEANHLNDTDFCTIGKIDTDDFTPEQALTRLAYKVHGEIL